MAKQMKSGQPVQTKIIDWSYGDPPLAERELVCAIGNFDGVHKGHQVVIEAAKTHANLTGLPLAVITFSPHPRQYFRPSDALSCCRLKRAKMHVWQLWG